MNVWKNLDEKGWKIIISILLMGIYASCRCINTWICLMAVSTLIVPFLDIGILTLLKPALWKKASWQTAQQNYVDILMFSVRTKQTSGCQTIYSVLKLSAFLKMLLSKILKKFVQILWKYLGITRRKILLKFVFLIYVSKKLSGKFKELLE